MTTEADLDRQTDIDGLLRYVAGSLQDRNKGGLPRYETENGQEQVSNSV